MSDEQRPRRELIIVSCTEIRSGKSQSGREWHLYNVVATNAEGIPVDHELRSFTKLEAKGAPQTFELEAGEYQGTPQFTLHLVRTRKVPERVEDLERRLLEAEERIARLEAQLAPAEGQAAPAGAPGGGEVW